jgi:hypothetical protein
MRQSFRRKSLATGDQPQIGNSILRDLERHSLLFVLRSCLRLIDVDDVLHLLQPSPFDSQKVCIATRITVMSRYHHCVHACCMHRLTVWHRLDSMTQTEIAKRYDFLLVVGYCILKSVFGLIVQTLDDNNLNNNNNTDNSEESEHAAHGTADDEHGQFHCDDSLEVSTEVQQILNKTRRNLDSITNLYYKLGLLETIFSFLFLSSNHAKRAATRGGEAAAYSSGAARRARNSSARVLYFATAAITRAILGLLRECIDNMYFQHASISVSRSLSSDALDLPDSNNLNNNNLNNNLNNLNNNNLNNNASSSNNGTPDIAAPNISSSMNSSDAIDADIQDRIQILRHRVKEALWRLEVVTKNSQALDSEVLPNHLLHFVMINPVCQPNHLPAWWWWWWWWWWWF